MADKLTVRFKPFKDESLISYFIRLSEKNGISLLPLLNSIKEIDSDYIQFSEIDIIDKIPFKHLNYNALEVLVGFNIDFLLKNTFYKLMERFSDTGEVEEIKICNKHKIKLLDSCPHCNHKIDYDKIISLGICSNCRKELSVNIEKEILDSNYFLYQTYLYEGWSKLIYGEYNKMNSQEIAYKILYILNEKRDFFNRERVKTKGLKRVVMGSFYYLRFCNMQGELLKLKEHYIYQLLLKYYSKIKLLLKIF